MDDEPFRHCDLESILKDPSAQPYDLRLQYLRDITDDFSTERELGRGGFGVVYKGILPNGKMIAVKNLVSSSEVQQKQFKNEVDNLMRVRHQNIVQFVGYCYETWLKYTDYNGKHIFAERPKRLLCFEYMPKGSLDRYISDESSGLDWPSRYKIIKGICCGLHYLHEECQTNASVIHLDLKPANILLDDNMEPKIADFGLSKFFDDQKVQTCATTIAGSHGYMAPEYIWDHIITTKADIYSLGVIIIEMITGRRIGPFCITVTSCQDFVEPVLGKWRNRFEETPRHASPELECQQIESCLQIGLSCIKIDRMERPTTKEIIEKLHRWESTNCYASNEENSHKDKGAHGNEDEDMDHAIALSLSEEDQRKGKAIGTGHHLDDDEQLARALQENTGHNLDEDEQLARALQESMNDGPPRPNSPIEDVHSESTPASSLPSNIFPTSDPRVCAGCKSSIGRGRFLSCMDSVWHPECFRCYACDRPISEYEFAVHENHAYHKPCYKLCFHPKCDVCNSFIPANKNGLIEYRAHPFWMQKYCPSHENDGTPRCCSCERMEPKDSQYITLDDGRVLCLECLHTAIMETNECQPLYIDIQEFYEGMNMKVEQQVPLLLVERQALNEAMEAEKSVHHLPETRGLCLSEEQIVRTILKRPIIGPGNRIIDMITGPYKLIRRCEVTAILILYGLPRLLTGSILAHEMMHAYLRLKGYRTLSPEVEEGICQVLAHLWLESEITSGSGTMATTSDASSSSSSTSSSSKKGAKTEFEKRLGEFFKYQIETDSSVAYGDGFRAGMRAVERYGLRSTLDHIKMTGSFPY